MLCGLRSPIRRLHCRFRLTISLSILEYVFTISLLSLCSLSVLCIRSEDPSPSHNYPPFRTSYRFISPINFERYARLDASSL